MLEGMYSAAAGMYAQQSRLDALSGDIANVNTAGYKPLRQGFRDLLYSQAGIATTDQVQLGAGSAVTDLGRQITQGSMQLTGQPLDIAVSGPGFFQVKDPSSGNLRLTRAGDLKLDAQGRLSTQAGQLLQPPITVPPGTDPAKLNIAPNGQIALNGKAVGQITLLNVAAPGELRPAGENAFEVTAESGPARAAGASTTITPGALEASGVSLADTMTSMVEAQRAYQLASRAITTQDKIAEIAIGVKR